MTDHFEMPHTIAAPSGAAPGRRDGSGSPSFAPAGTLLHGAAFVLLCLWTRTSPDSLRDQLAADADACPALGF